MTLPKKRVTPPDNNLVGPPDVMPRLQRNPKDITIGNKRCNDAGEWVTFHPQKKEGQA